MISEREAELEAKARLRGIERHRSATERALAREAASETSAGLDMLRRTLDPAANAIATFMVETELRPGRRPTAFLLCGHCDPYLLAYGYDEEGERNYAA